MRVTAYNRKPLKMIKSDKIEFSVIGAGRFGQFWGRHISHHYSVCFYDIDTDKKAKISKFARWESLQNCLDKKYIFLTIPINQLENFLKTNAKQFKPGNILIDCASVKVPVMDWFARYVPENVFYAASHPLFGPDSARQKLRDHRIVLIPGRIPLKNYNTLVRIFSQNLGLNVYSMTAEEHDELMAYNLNLVHYLGRVLYDLGISKLPLMMSSLQKLNDIVTVVMKDSKELFTDFHRYNPYSEAINQKWQNAVEKVGKQIKEKLL